jgi:hypothetical protein
LANASATIFPKLVALLEDIGHMLPHFQKYAASGLLDRNDGAKRAMSLFLRDILDLHAAMLHFFQKPGNLFAPFWVMPESGYNTVRSTNHV